MLEHSENAHQGDEDEENTNDGEMGIHNIKEEVIEESVPEEGEENEGEMFEDPLRILNSITKSNSNKTKTNKQDGNNKINKEATSGSESQPVRRSMRSGRKDYAKMLKLDDEADSEEEEEEIDDGQIQDEDSESDVVLEKIKKKTDGKSFDGNKNTKTEGMLIINTYITIIIDWPYIFVSRLSRLSAYHTGDARLCIVKLTCRSYRSGLSAIFIQF